MFQKLSNLHLHSMIPDINENTGLGVKSFLSEPVKITEQVWDENTPVMVSITCTTYNHESYIREAIEGFLMQKTTFRVEIVVHDDASTDQTAMIVKEYEHKYPRLFKCFYQTENTFRKPDKHQLRKPFVEAQHGRYIAKCEGDDYWSDPLKLQKQVDFLEANPDYAFCVGGFFRLYDDTKKKLSRLNTFKKNDIGKSGYTFSLPDMQKYWLTQPLTAMLRKDLIWQLDLLKYKYKRDVHLYYHLAKLGKCFYFSEYFGVHRVHPGGVHSMIGRKTSIQNLYLLYKELYEINKDEFSRIMYLHQIVLLANYILYNADHEHGFKQVVDLICDFFGKIRGFSDLKYLIILIIPVRFKNQMRELVK